MLLTLLQLWGVVRTTSQNIIHENNFQGETTGRYLYYFKKKNFHVFVPAPDNHNINCIGS